MNKDEFELPLLSKSYKAIHDKDEVKEIQKPNLKGIDLAHVKYKQGIYNMLNKHVLFAYPCKAAEECKNYVKDKNDLTLREFCDKYCSMCEFHRMYDLPYLILEEAGHGKAFGLSLHKKKVKKENRLN